MSMRSSRRASMVHSGQTFSQGARPAGKMPRAPSMSPGGSSRRSSQASMGGGGSSQASSQANTPRDGALTPRAITPEKTLTPSQVTLDRPTTPGAADYALEEFLSKNPSYEKTNMHFNNLRKREFSRLDGSDKKTVYLDHAGAALHSEGMLKQHIEELNKTVLGDPTSTPGAASSEVVETARADVLKYFKADPEEFTVIFTTNGSTALDIVGSYFPFQKDSTFMLTSDNHESVYGISEHAKAQGSKVEFLNVEDEDLRLCQTKVIQAFGNTAHSPTAPKLFAFPAQSNFTGVKHPLALIDMARKAGFEVLLDGDAYCPTNSLNLSIGWMKPDFLTISFAKMFGFPAGMGALILKKTALEKKLLPRRTSTGLFTTGNAELCLKEKHILYQDHRAFENGAVDYLNAAAVSAGLDFLKFKCGGVDNITARTKALTAYLHKTLGEMKHKKGGGDAGKKNNSIVHFYGPEDLENRGNILPFNVLDCEGKNIPFKDVAALAKSQGILLGAGSFGNPGACEAAFHWGKEIKYDSIKKAEDFKPATPGCLRVSFGTSSNFHDAYALVEFLETLLDFTVEEVSKKASYC